MYKLKAQRLQAPEDSHIEHLHDFCSVLNWQLSQVGRWVVQAEGMMNIKFEQ
jgi:hypothetical protein